MVSGRWWEDEYVFGGTFHAGFAHTSIPAHMVPHGLHLRGSVGLFSLCIHVCARACMHVCV